MRIPTILSGLLLCLTVNAAAQSPGRVVGRVLDQTGAALPGVAIDLLAGSKELTRIWRSHARASPIEIPPERRFPARWIA